MGKLVDFLVFDEIHGIVRLKNKMVAYLAMMDFLEALDEGLRNPNPRRPSDPNEIHSAPMLTEME